MSQSGRIVTDIPVPGAGIETITGNAGGAVPGDGAANINLVGAGTITVTGVPGANTLTISSTGVPATYTTDAGIVIPDGAGNLNVDGGANINTDAAAANTVTINLNDTVVLAGDLTAHDINGTHDIAATQDVTAGGNVTATGIIYGVAGARFDDQVEITANGISSTGATVLNSLNRGVVQVDAAHTLTSSEGADGQLLIGSSIGAVAWRTLTAGAGIAITNGNNIISIATAGSVARVYNADAGAAIPVAGYVTIAGGTNINTAAGGNTVTINLDPAVTITSLTTTGSVIVGTSLSVGGNADVHDTLTTADLVVGNDAFVAGTLTVQGATTIASMTASGTIGAVGNIISQATVQGYNIVATNNVTANGDLYISHLNGVLQTGGTGLVNVTNGNPTGTNGQLLVSGPTAPIWAALQSTAGTVAITYPAANTINLEAASFNTYPIAATLYSIVNWEANSTYKTYYFGQRAAMTTDYDPNGCFYGGDGVDAHATYTCPKAGLYLFNFKLVLGIAAGNSVPYMPCGIFIINESTGQAANSGYPVLLNANISNSTGLISYPIEYFASWDAFAYVSGAPVAFSFAITPQYLTSTVSSRNMTIGNNNIYCRIFGCRVG